jgi:CheY-like chemotaxis protein
MKLNSHRVLLVDDNEEERFLTERALKSVASGVRSVHLAVSGNSAIAYMMGEREFADRGHFPFPTLVITDLKMPDGDGFDVLEFLQANPEWSVLPRVVFSSSEDEDDIRTAFLLGANAYHLKPSSLSQLSATLYNILTYWLSCQTPLVNDFGRLIVAEKAGVRGTRFPPAQGSPHMVRVYERSNPGSAGALAGVGNSA